MLRHHLFYCLGLRLTLLGFLACQVATLAAQEKVRIAMRPDAIIGSTNVRLGDLAIVEGRSDLATRSANQCQPKQISHQPRRDDDSFIDGRI